MYGLGSAILDVTEQAIEGKLAPVYGRANEIDSVMDVLSWMHPKQLLIVGPSGIGKTKFVHGLAAACVQRAKTDHTPLLRILQLHVSVLQCGTVRVYDGITRLLHSAHRRPDEVLFLDGIYPVLTRPSERGCAVTMMNEAIRRVHVRCIGTMTTDQFNTFKEMDHDVIEKFKIISLDPLTEEDTGRILEKMRPELEREFDIHIPARAVRKTLELTREYAPDQPFPGKGVTVLRRACAYCSQRVHHDDSDKGMVIESSVRELGGEVATVDLVQAVSEMTSKDVARAEADKWRDQFSRRLCGTVLGQNGAIDQITDTMARVRDQFRQTSQVVSAMLFAGSPGVGKRHAAGAMLRALTGDASRPIVYDMRQYNDPGAGARLFAASPSQGGNLDARVLAASLQAVPLTICIFDGVEQADASVLSALEDVLQEGSFKAFPALGNASGKCLFVLLLHCAPPPADFRRMPLWLKHTVLRVVPRGLLEHIETVAPFRSLEPDTVMAIVDRSLKPFNEDLARRGLTVTYDETVRPWLTRKVHNPGEGLFRLGETLQQMLFAPVYGLVNREGESKGATIRVHVQWDALVFEMATAGASVGAPAERTSAMRSVKPEAPVP